MAKWDLSKLPEGRKPLPDEWFVERAQMQDRIKELEANLTKALRAMTKVDEARENWNKKQDEETFCELGAAVVNNHETLAELTGGKDE